jgi:hypothetical protein
LLFFEIQNKWHMVIFTCFKLVTSIFKKWWENRPSQVYNSVFKRVTTLYFRTYTLGIRKVTNMYLQSGRFFKIGPKAWKINSATGFTESFDAAEWRHRFSNLRPLLPFRVAVIILRWKTLRFFFVERSSTLENTHSLPPPTHTHKKSSNNASIHINVCCATYIRITIGWPDWAIFRHIGECLLWAVSWKLQK